MNEGKRHTFVVNLFGGPGSGKSTLMAALFYRLKCMGIETEMAPEFAKDLIWEDRRGCFSEQIYIFGEQLHRIERLIGKVDVCISDSPLQNSYIYLKEDYPELKALVDKEFSRFDNINFLVKRGKRYTSVGRNEDYEQALVADRRIEDVLSSLPHTIITHDDDPEIIANIIIDKIREENDRRDA